MSADVRQEIVHLVQLKSIPTHHLKRLTTDSFSFVKVVNRKVRSVDGDVPCGDGKGIYKSGSIIYVRLNDDSLWAKKIGIKYGLLLSSMVRYAMVNITIDPCSVCCGAKCLLSVLLPILSCFVNNFMPLVYFHTCKGCL